MFFVKNVRGGGDSIKLPYSEGSACSHMYPPTQSFSDEAKRKEPLKGTTILFWTHLHPSSQVT